MKLKLVLKSTWIINFTLPILAILLPVYTVSLMWVTNKVGIEETGQSDGYRVPAHKLLFFSQVIGLFTVKLVIFDFGEMSLVDIRIVVFWSSFK